MLTNDIVSFEQMGPEFVMTSNNKDNKVPMNQNVRKCTTGHDSPVKTQIGLRCLVCPVCSVFAVQLKEAWTLISYPESTQQRPWSDADLSLA